MRFEIAKRLKDLAESIGCPVLITQEDLNNERYVVAVCYEGTWQRITGKTLVADVKFLESQELSNGS